MDKNKQYKVALVLYTQGLDYDDRIRKEILSIKKIYPNVSFQIFAVEPKNREEMGVTAYGIPYKIPYLSSREKYSSGSHTLAKAWDFYLSIKEELKHFDAVWCADIETFLFVLFNRKKPLAWDLHELPTPFMGKQLLRSFFKFLVGKCTIMIHANEARLQSLREMKMINRKTKQYYLQNFPQFDEIDTEYDDTYREFEKWLGDEKCVYLQGLNEATRAPYESISAVLQIPDLKCVVVGRVDKPAVDKVKELYGEDVLKSRVYFTGMIKQLKTPQYIRKCITSLVFYKNTCLNNWYCEANRFYQNIINGNPVITGANPPMKALIDKYGFGIALNSDGSNEAEIVEAMTKLFQNYDEYKKNIAQNKDKLLWESQNDTIKDIVLDFLHE